MSSAKRSLIRSAYTLRLSTNLYRHFNDQEVRRRARRKFGKGI